MKHQGQLELTWTDKDKALLSTGDGKYDYTFVDRADYRVSEVRLLHEVSRHDAEAPADRPAELAVPTADNLLITGDAMHVLDALRNIPEYADKYIGKVKLCYIDPPFNTGQAFEQYEDNIEHSVWLTMLRDRLEQIKPLLSDDGSVWVHLDDVEVHRCRAVLDEVMGIHNFVATVIWQKADSPRNSARHFSTDQDYLLVYANDSNRWRPRKLPRTAESNAAYANPDDDPRGPWVPGDPFANKPYSLGLYEVTGPTGNVFGPPPGRYWRIAKETFQELDRDGRIWWRGGGEARPRIKRYLAEVSDLVPRTIWDYAAVGSSGDASREVRKLFPDVPVFSTPKPERLMQRIIATATELGDVVLDCFAGSGTTAAVAHKMGRRWVASELLTDNVITFTKPRLLKVIEGDDAGGITSSKSRVAAVEGGELPDGLSPVDAQAFNTQLTKVLRAIEAADVRTIRALKVATRTREETTVNWHGGGGFTHLTVGESMFEESGGRVFLAEWAVTGALTNAMCAQLGVRHQPDGIFAARKGKVRYVILDGMVTDSTVAAILDQLPDGDVVEVWATQLDPAAIDTLRKARPGSRLRAIPTSVLDSYRRKAVSRSPFAPSATDGEKP